MNNKKTFILIEAVLALMASVVAFSMFWERNDKKLDKVSVIVQNSDSNQWTAFKYGLKMAAEDLEVEMVVVSTDNFTKASEEKSLIENEISSGADAVIVQPVPDPDTEAMLKKMSNKIPIMLVKSEVSKDSGGPSLPVTKPDNYAMGRDLAEGLLTDYGGSLQGKTLGIVSETDHSEAGASREAGFKEGIKNSGAEITWTVSDVSSEFEESMLSLKPKVDFVIALDDSSLILAGKAAEGNNLHGALVYGIGNSTEAVYYLDTGKAECLIVPDEFYIGYESLTEAAEYLENSFKKMQDKTVSYTVLRRETLFSKENQELLFTMSQ